jgi:hypothetical protein
MAGFSLKASALGPLFHWVFRDLGPVLDPYFLGVFKGEFSSFFTLLKIAFPGFLTPMKTALESRGRSTTHRRLTSIPGNVLGF